MIESSLTNKSTDPQQLILLREECESASRKFQLTGMNEYLSLQKKFEQKVKALENELQQEQAIAIDSKTLIESISDPEFWKSLDAIALHRYINEVVKTCWIENKKIVKIELNL